MNWRTVTVLLAVALAGIFSLRFLRTAPPVPAATASVVAPVVSAVKPPPPAETAIDLRQAEIDRRLRLMNNSTNREEFKLTPQEVYSYVEANRSNAVSLLAGFQLTEDREFLKAAAAKYPNDPMVQAQVLFFDLFPEDRAKWIAAFKQSAPDNSLANLVAAREAVKNGDLKTALAEVRASEGKSINDFTREAMQGMEEAYLHAGRTPSDAKALGMSNVLLPQYAQIKWAGNQFVDAAKNETDAAAKANYLQANWEIGSQFRQLGGHSTLLADMVGLAMQNSTLRAWPADTPAPFVDGTPQQVLDSNVAYRKEIKADTGMFDKWFPTAPENEIITYMDRTKTFGELDAMKWLRARHPELAQAQP